MFTVSIKLDSGAMERLTNRMNAIRNGLEWVAGPMAVKGAAEQYYELVISRMGEVSPGGGPVFSQTYWPPLSQKWLGIKRAHGLVEEIWEATGETKGAIRVHAVQKIPNGFSVFVGLKDVAPDILQKAIENEFGVDFGTGGISIYMSHIPKRALFEPAKREMLHVPWRRDLLVKEFTLALKEAMRGVVG